MRVAVLIIVKRMGRIITSKEGLIDRIENETKIGVCVCGGKWKSSIEMLLTKSEENGEKKEFIHAPSPVSKIRF